LKAKLQMSGGQKMPIPSIITASTVTGQRPGSVSPPAPHDTGQLGAGEDYVTTLAIYADASNNETLYVGLNIKDDPLTLTYPGKIVPVDAASLTEATPLTLHSDEASVRSLAVAGNALYAATTWLTDAKTGATQAAIVQIDLTNPQSPQEIYPPSWAMGPDTDKLANIEIVGNTLYAAYHVAPASHGGDNVGICQIDLVHQTRSQKTFTLGNASGVDLYGNAYVAMAVDATSIYVASFSDKVYVQKLDSSTLLPFSVGTNSYTVPMSYGPVTAMAVSANYLFVGCQNGYLIKMDPTAFQPVGSPMQLGTKITALLNHVTPTGSHLYAGLDTDPGTIVPIDPVNFIQASGWSLRSGFAHPSALASGRYHQRQAVIPGHGAPPMIMASSLYAGCWTTPAKFDALTLAFGG
jgi:hypothetical protein